MSQTRIKYIDLAKGICILLVVIMHYSIATGYKDLPFERFIANLRMPLYYFLSGLFFKDYGGFLHTVLKKVNRLIIPAIFFIIIALPIHYKAILNGEMILLPLSADEFMQWNQHNIALWFLFSLFWTNLLFYPLIVYIKKEWIRALIVLSLPLLSPLAFAATDNLLFLASTLTSAPFFYLGYLIGRKSTLLTDHISVQKLTLFCVIAFGLALGIWLAQGEESISIIEGITGLSQLPLYLVASLLILAVIAFCRLLVYLPLISWFGRYSIIILGTHLPIYEIIHRLTSGLESSDPVWCTLRIVIAIPILAAAIYILTRYTPHLCAQKDLIPIRLNTKKNLIKS